MLSGNLPPDDRRLAHALAALVQLLPHPEPAGSDERRRHLDQPSEAAGDAGCP